jgi:hypothetical protein
VTNLKELQEIRKLRLIFHRFEFNGERTKIFGEFLQEVSSLEELELINFYIKSYKMDFSSILEFAQK